MGGAVARIQRASEGPDRMPVDLWVMGEPKGSCDLQGRLDGGSRGEEQKCDVFACQAKPRNSASALLTETMVSRSRWPNVSPILSRFTVMALSIMT